MSFIQNLEWFHVSVLLQKERQIAAWLNTFFRGEGITQPYVTTFSFPLLWLKERLLGWRQHPHPASPPTCTVGSPKRERFESFGRISEGAGVQIMQMKPNRIRQTGSGGWERVDTLWSGSDTWWTSWGTTPGAWRQLVSVEIINIRIEAMLYSVKNT